MSDPPGSAAVSAAMSSEDRVPSPVGDMPALMDGVLMKRSSTLLRWRWRFVQLTPDQRLQTFKPASAEQEERVITEDICVRDASIEATDFKLAAPVPFGFTVSAGDRRLCFAAESASQREAWILKLSKVAGRAAKAPAPHPDGRAELEHQHSSNSVDGDGSNSRQSPSAKAAGSAAGKGKGKGKGPPPPPPSAKKASAPPPTAVEKKAALPIGRRLTVRMLAAPDAEAFAAPVADLGSASSSEAEAELPGARVVNPAAIDLEALRSAFAPQPKAAVPIKSSKKSPRGVELLPRNAAQNVAIVLHKLRLDTAALAESLDRLQPADCPLPAEDSERFLQVLPAPEVLRPLSEFSGDTAKLRDVERKLLPLARLTRLSQRLRLLSLFKTLDERLGEAMRQMTTLQGACGAVRKSAVLRDLLQIVLVLFNYINYGQEPSGADNTGKAPAKRARNVDVQSLTRLVETQSYGGPFAKFNMLHFCLQELLKQRPELRRQDVEKELGMLPDASCISLGSIKLALERLQEDLSFVRVELYGHRKDYAPPEEPEEEVAEEEPKGPASFDLEEGDTASEDESIAEHSPAGQERKGLVERLLAFGIDTLSFAEDWRQGNARITTLDHGLENVMASDGEVPPPGLLWRLCPSGMWKLYFCEVRGALLVLYRIRGDSSTVGGTSYMFLPGAEVASMASLFASERAREMSASYPHGLELRPSEGGSVMLRAKTRREAERWIDFLSAQAQQGGAGYLSLYQGGWGLFTSRWNRLFCAIHRPPRAVEPGSVTSDESGTCLVAFKHARDYAEGLRPEFSWPLEDVVVRPFDGEGASDDARSLLSVAPVGFEVEYFDTGKCVQFACDSLEQQRMWLDALRALGSPSAQRTPVRRAARCVQSLSLFLDEDEERIGAVDSAKLFDLFKETPPKKYQSFHVVEEVQSAGSSNEELRRRLMFSLGAMGSKLEEPKEDSDGIGALEPDTALKQEAPAPETSVAGEEAGLLDWEATTVSSSALVDAKPASPASSGTLASEAESVHPVDALSQLRHLESEMAGAVEQWSRTLAATEADCRNLLRFFGLATPDDLRIAVSQLLTALATFEGQVQEALTDLEQHGSEVPTANPLPAAGGAQTSPGADGTSVTISASAVRKKRRPAAKRRPKTDALQAAADDQARGAPESDGGSFVSVLSESDSSQP